MQIWFYVLQVNQFIKERERQRKMERMNLQGIEERERKRKRQTEEGGTNESTRN